jgi:tetraacyldisaccharide 4'-kinase
MVRSGSRADVPVICVGNYVAGGAGKTPTAIACAYLLRQKGWRPAFLSRGYGGSASRGAPLRVDALKHDSRLAGDEALLLAQHAPTVVAADRIKAARVAQAAGCDVIVMDDGLQNPSLSKDFRVAVADAETGIGNGACIPAGPLRAPLEAQLALTDALILIGQGEAGDRLAGRALARGIAVFRAHLRPDDFAASKISLQRVVAFAGIGRPEKFFATLEAAGANVVDAYSFDDHQMLTEANLRSLRETARKANALLVTTEKDIARLRGLTDISGIETLPVTLRFEDERAFVDLMLSKINGG